MVMLVASTLSAQHDLLPIEHPATERLLRYARLGLIPDFPIEHLPISRGEARSWFERVVATSTSTPVRADAAWYLRALDADRGTPDSLAIVIPTSSHDRSLFSDLDRTRPWSGVAFDDSATGGRLRLDPVLDADTRIGIDGVDGVEGVGTVLQGGVRLRGTVGPAGFSAVATNGTILGNDTVVRTDPRFGRSFKFGQIAINRDVDFGSGHLRLAFDGLGFGIARESVRLGAGDASSLLLGADLPSYTDWLRVGAQIGPFSYTHIHAALLAEPETGFRGAFSEIPSKFVAAHLLTLSDVGPIRISVGESVIYADRGFEIGYLNPFNFLKSQEHFLRDRDNSMLYGALSVTPTDGLALEGDLLIDDLIFGNIGTGAWGNKTAWRAALRSTGLGLETVDALLEYTRVEPYTYSHFRNLNAYRHDGAALAASGLSPNSDLLRVGAAWYPRPWLAVRADVERLRHGANPIDSVTGDVVRNVGGDIGRGFDSLSATTVTFLDGAMEREMRIAVGVDAELFRNVYLRLRLLAATLRRDGDTSGLPAEESALQGQIGLRIGAY